MNGVEGQTFKLGQGEVKTCSQIKTPARRDSFEKHCNSDSGFSSGVEPCCIFKAVWYCAPEELERVTVLQNSVFFVGSRKSFQPALS